MTDLTARDDWWRDWPTWELRVLEVADGRALLVAATAGIAFDAGVRSGVVTLGGTLSVLVAGLGLLASGRLRTAASRTCVGVAMVLALFLTVRTSVWLVPLNVGGIAGLLVLAGVLGRDGRLADLPARLLASRAIVAVGHGLASAAFLVEPVRMQLSGIRPRRGAAGAVARGIVIALPIVLILGALMVSADAVFASVVRIDLSVPDNVLVHAVLIAGGALAIGGVLRAASATPAPELPAVGQRLGSVEWTIVLGSVVLLFSGFAIAQVVTLAGGARHVLETEGLTYAEYARTGYAQLLAVAALTGLVLGVLGAIAARPSRSTQRRFTVLAELTVALTAVVLIVAVRRLGLYENAYGWTMLRLIAKAGAAWIGIVLVLLAGRLGGVARDREWFVSASVAAGVAVVMALNIANPEAAVARHNLQYTTDQFDPVYLGALNDDAVPTIVAALPALSADRRAAVVETLCVDRSEPTHGFLSWNLSARRADAARSLVCR